LKSSRFSKGDIVIRENEMGDVFYIVEEGEAIATKTMEPGKIVLFTLRQTTCGSKEIP
jgi:cAMP-dependent protein kinase regulator